MCLRFHLPTGSLVCLAAVLGALTAAVPAAALAATGDIYTVAGNGTSGFAGDGGPATSAELSFPAGAAALPSGGFLIADRGNCVVRRVSPAGKISTVAGTAPSPGTHCGYSGDGVTATSAELGDKLGSLAPLPNGGFLIDDGRNCLIRRVSRTGIISAVAGTTAGAGTDSNCGYGGDGGPALGAMLGKDTFEAGVALVRGGGYVIADVSNCLIRKVSPTGMISTVAGLTAGAGSGTNCGYSGDNGPATAAGLKFPDGVAGLPGGGFLIVDSVGTCRVRRVSPGGTITLAAGTPACGYSGDGGPATSAQLGYSLSNVYALSRGGFLIADLTNCIVRQVSAGGRIATVAGTPPTGSTTHCGYTGDGHPATSATLSEPSAVAAASDGGFYIADYANSVIRRVAGFPPRVTITGHPKAKLSTKHKKVTVRFSFRSNEALSTFKCKLDRDILFRPCSSPTAYRVKPGTHTFSVFATNEFHATGPVSSFSFQVKHKHKHKHKQKKH